MAELKTALTSKITSDNDTRDYDFGRVGNTNYVYINNEETKPIVSIRGWEYDSVKNPFKNPNYNYIHTKLNYRGTYLSGENNSNHNYRAYRYPWCFNTYHSTKANPTGGSNYEKLQSYVCPRGSSSTSGNFSLSKLSSADAWPIRPSDWDTNNNFTPHIPYYTRIRIPIADFLVKDSNNNSVSVLEDAEQNNYSISRIKGILNLIQPDGVYGAGNGFNNSINQFYYLYTDNEFGYKSNSSTEAAERITILTSQGDYRSWNTWGDDNNIYGIPFDLPILPNQKYLVFEIYTNICNNWTGEDGSAASIEWWEFTWAFETVSYRPKFQGNIFTAPNNETLFCTGTANTGPNDTIVNFLGGSVENRQVWPKEYLNSNVNEINLNSSVTSTIIKSNPANTNTAFEIYLNWLTGEYQGYYQNKTGSYSLTSTQASTQGEKFDVGNDSPFTLIFGEASTNKLTIKPQSKTITELPVVISGGKAELTIKNFLNNVTALIDRQNIEDRLEEIQTAISKTQSSIDRVYIAKEIGDYYITESNINPASRFGGTWKLVSSPDNNPVVLIASGSTTGTYGAFWRLYSDGYLIQYSRDANVNLSNITYDASITYPISFANTDYHLGGVGFVISRCGEQFVKKSVNGFSTSSNVNGSATKSWVAQGQCNSTTYNSYLKEYKQKHPEHFAYKWQKISNDKDPSNPQSFTTQSANITYNVALEQFPVGYIYRKDVDPTNPPTSGDNWLPCDGQTITSTGAGNKKYEELIRLLTGPNTADTADTATSATSATLPLLNQNDNIGTEKITYDGATLIKQICFDKKASTEHNVSLINFYSNGLLEQIGYINITGNSANNIVTLAYPYRGPDNYTVLISPSDQEGGVYNTSNFNTQAAEVGWGANTNKSFRIGTNGAFGWTQRVNFKTIGFCDQTTFNALFPENKRPKYWIKAANSVRQNSLPNLIDHSLNIHYYGNIAQNLKNLSKDITAKKRGPDNFFLDSGNLNIDPNKFKKSIITIKAYDSARNCIMYRFDIDWQLKTLQFFTDDYTATEYLSAGINSPWTYNLTTNNRFIPIKGDTTRYLEFDNKGYIKTLPLPPFSNISTLDVMCENYKC